MTPIYRVCQPNHVPCIAQSRNSISSIFPSSFSFSAHLVAPQLSMKSIVFPNFSPTRSVGGGGGGGGRGLASPCSDLSIPHSQQSPISPPVGTLKSLLKSLIYRSRVRRSSRLVTKSVQRLFL